MNTGIATFRKRWPALAAIAVLVAIALAAGTLFAANERQQQPELPTVSQQSVMDATDPVRAVEPPEAPPAPERVFTQPDDNYEEETDLPPIVKTPPRYSNLDSNLNRLVDEASSAQQTRSADGGASATVEPVLVTFYIEPERVAYVREYLETNGVFVRNVGEDYIEAHVLPSMLGAASEQPGILRVDTVIPPRRSQSQNRVISQGVGLHGADAWHNVGYRGDSVKVGVIDGGFERFHQLQQGGELASNVVARCYFADARSPSSRLSDCEKDGDHGTAVAETTLDVAPNATLYVANPFSKGDMQDAARWMATQGVQVINHSVGWLFDGPGDGTSPFSNSPLRTIDSAVASGAMWVNAAGNGARRTWYGTFRNPNRSTTDVQFHHWSSDDIGNSFALREGDSITAFMRWDDSWGTADCDLDLVLWRSFPAIQQILIIDADLRFQNGSQGSVPFAIVSREEVASWQEGIYFLTISKDNPNSCPDDPAWIQLVAWVDYPELQYHSPTHHMGNPEESRNPGFLAVGATHYWNTNAIAPYSNRGPALDGRTKPDITGVACGQSTVYAPDTLDDGTECWFPGTSQAAPHVAGLAALVRQRFADYNPVQTVRYLQQNAAERGPSGADNTWGYGLATLPSPSAEPTSGSGDIAPTGNIAVRNGINPGEAVISWDAVPQATHYRIGYVNMVQDYPLAKASVTGEWIEAFVYVDVNARNFTVSGGRAQYVIRRLAQGDRHAFTVLTSSNFVDTGGGGSVSSEFFWPPIGSRWEFHTVADRGGACPGVAAASASADLGRASPAASRGSIGQGDPGPPPDVPFERRHITLDAPAMGALSGEAGNGRFAGQMEAARVATQGITPPVANIRVVDSQNPGEVVISWDAVPAATHYRIGYVNMVQDYPLAKASVTGEWIEAFVYVDVNARNFTVSGGRAQYVIRRLAQGDRHAFTVLTSSNFVDTGGGGSVSSEFFWPPIGSRWEFHTVADRGGACPTAGVPIVTPPAVVTSLAGLRHGEWLEQNRPQAAVAIRALPWVRDGISGSERQAAEALIATARWYPDVFGSLMQMSWLGDGVTDDEAIATTYIRHTAFFDSQAPVSDLAGQMLRKSWVQDAISADEATVIRYLYWTVSYDTDSPPLPQVIAEINAAASRILAMPFLATVESPDALGVRSLERIEDISKTDFLQVMARPTLNDGITDEEAEIVLLLGATYQYADHALIDTLLDPTRITVEKRAIRLPRSGEVDLAIIRTAPGPARSMDLLEHSVRGIEEFMGTPFPTNHVAALFEESGREKAAGVNFGTHITMRPKYDVDDSSHDANFLPILTAHEVAHYYWRGNETWIDEGGATFMEFPVENMRTGRGLIADRYPCAYVSSIAEVVALDPEQLSPADICNYSLGERIFLDLYRNLEDAAYRQGFSSLYQRSQVLDERLWPTELNINHVRDAFQPIAPAATAVINRWYNGPRPQGIAPPDTGSVNPELATIAGGQVINAFVSSEDDWDAFGGWESFIARGTENFSVADAAGKSVFVYLGFTFPVTVDPKILRLEVIEHYEDGFLYEDYVARLEFEPEWTRARARVSVGPGKDDPWLPGRYWAFLYDGDRKVAEVTYEATP